MNWPPVKSWTSLKSINGFKHYVAFNYGDKDNLRWILLVAVLDGNTRLKLNWNEIKDSANWIEGWTAFDFTGEDIEQESNKFFALKEKFDPNRICLHPSKDSGLQIPNKTTKIRKWLLREFIAFVLR